MTRHASHIVPPVPQGLPEREMDAFRFWRRGLCIREAARMAGVHHIRLFEILYPNQKEAA